jgi:hypothetical protein
VGEEHSGNSASESLAVSIRRAQGRAPREIRRAVPAAAGWRCSSADRVRGLLGFQKSEVLAVSPGLHSLENRPSGDAAHRATHASSRLIRAGEGWEIARFQDWTRAEPVRVPAARRRAVPAWERNACSRALDPSASHSAQLPGQYAAASPGPWRVWPSAWFVRGGRKQDGQRRRSERSTEERSSDACKPAAPTMASKPRPSRGAEPARTPR